jgi:hypothetical protein
MPQKTTLGTMGIRYLAHPVSARQIEQSNACPRGCFEAEDAWENWFPDHEPTLSLEKCYPEMQRLLGELMPRLSYALVEGDVTHVGYGWRSFRRILDLDQTRAIADDLDALLAEPSRLLSVPCRFGDRDDCTTPSLVRAREFARQVADAGYGIHYLIG